MQTDIINMAREECPYTSDEMRGAFYEGFLKGASAEQDRCCKIIYSMAGSDNVAQRTVDAIRGKQ